MKKMLSNALSILLAAVMLIAFGNRPEMEMQASAAESVNVSAAEEDAEEFIPVYTIEDLYNIRNDLDANYRLMNDIDLTEATAKDGEWDFMGNGWNPIGSNNIYGDGIFTGIFDGGGHAIKGMRIEVYDWSSIPSTTKTIYLGLFSRVSGEIRNLHLEGGRVVTIENGSLFDLYAGGIAGESAAAISGCSSTASINVKTDNRIIYGGGIAGSSSGTVLNCCNGGSVQAGRADRLETANAYIGGIVGKGSGNIVIAGCYNTGQVNAAVSSTVHYPYAGGILGYGEAATVTNCYNTGEITATNNYRSAYAGGIVGSTGNYLSDTSISYCYNTGKSKHSAIGAVEKADVHDCYYLAGTGDGSTGSVSLTEAQMKLQSMYRGFDFDKVWAIIPCSGYLYPQLQANLQAPANHNFGDWQVRKTATCIDKGEEYRVCVCGEEETKEIPALGHSFTKYVPDNNAACAENGTETAKCDRCDATDTRAIENSALGHHYSAEWTVDQEPTCTEPGSKSHHCAVCGDKTDITEIPALGHSFTKYIPDNNATCTEDGTETAKCDRCDATDTRVIENSTTEHNYSLEWTVDKKPTCTEPGSKSHHCIVCKDKADITEIPAAHTFGPWVVTVPPTSDTEGVRERVCSACGEVEKRTIAPVAAMPQIVVDSKTTHAGDTVTVNVSVKNNPGIIAMILQINYDASILELQEANAKDFADVSFGPMDNQPFTLSWEDAIHPNTTTDGAIVELVFKVKQEAPPVETAITVTYDEENIFNSDFDNVFFEMVPGSVAVSKYQPGDLNRDDSVNMKDYALFKQYLTGWDVDIELSVADVTGDGSVNMKDLALLRQWLNGWEVELQ